MSDGLAAWIDEHIIYEVEAKSYIGNNSREWVDMREYNGFSSSLYGSYSVFCKSTGRSNPVSLNKFSSQLLEILGQLKFDSVKKKGKKGAFITNIRLRTGVDDENGLPTISELLHQEVTAGDGVTATHERVTAKVTAETLAQREGDGGDGYGEKNHARENFLKNSEIVSQLNTSPSKPENDTDGCCVEELTSKSETKNINNDVTLSRSSPPSPPSNINGSSHHHQPSPAVTSRHPVTQKPEKPEKPTEYKIDDRVRFNFPNNPSHPRNNQTATIKRIYSKGTADIVFDSDLEVQTHALKCLTFPDGRYGLINNRKTPD